MYCPKCSSEIPEGSVFCPKCGVTLAQSSSIQQPVASPPPDKASGMSIASMVIGIVGVVSSIFGILLGPIAIIISVIELKRIKKGVSSSLSKTFALVGLILGIITIVITLIMVLILAAIAVPNFLSAQSRSKVSRTKAELRTCATALEAYYIDNNAYPQPDYDTQNNPVLPHILTTPVSYITSIPYDPFTGDWRRLYRYHTGLIESEDTGKPYWIITGQGPDQKSDIDVSKYNPQDPVWAESQGALFTYDPTNGTVSRGDIWRRGP